MEGGGEEEDAVVGAEGEVRGDEETIKVASIQTWNLWRGAGALEEVGIGGMVARRVMEEAGTGDMAGLIEVVAKKEMATEEALAMEELGRGVAIGTGTLEAKTGVGTRKGQGNERGTIQGEQAVAPMRQGVEKKEVMEDLEEELNGMEGEIVLAGCKVSSRKQGQGVGQIVETASPRKLSATRSGRSSRRGSLLDSSCFCACHSLKFISGTYNISSAARVPYCYKRT